jgi:hypothetical protein
MEMEMNANIKLPLIGMKNGVYPESEWYASTEESCAYSESAPIVDSSGETVLLVVNAGDFYPSDSKEIAARVEFVLRACNSHDALVKALEEIRDMENERNEWDGVERVMPAMRDIARAALAAATA